MLRDEAYSGDRMEAQLEDAARRFLSDRSRNRFDAASGVLEVSRIFDWYRADFEKGAAAKSVSSYLARYADVLADGTAARARVGEGRAHVRFLDYDWKLNGVR